MSRPFQTWLKGVYWSFFQHGIGWEAFSRLRCRKIPRQSTGADEAEEILDVVFQAGNEEAEVSLPLSSACSWFPPCRVDLYKDRPPGVPPRGLTFHKHLIVKGVVRSAGGITASLRPRSSFLKAKPQSQRGLRNLGNQMFLNVSRYWTEWTEMDGKRQARKRLYALETVGIIGRGEWI